MELKLLLASSGAIDLIIDALERLSDDEDIIDTTLTAIGTLSLGCRAIQDVLFDRGVVDGMVDAAENFEESPNVMASCSRAVANLASMNEAICEDFNFLDVQNDVMNSMERFPNHWSVQIDGCAALGVLASEGEDDKKRIGSYGSKSFYPQSDIHHLKRLSHEEARGPLASGHHNAFTLNASCRFLSANV